MNTYHLNEYPVDLTLVLFGYECRMRVTSNLPAHSLGPDNPMQISLRFGPPEDVAIDFTIYGRQLGAPIYLDEPDATWRPSYARCKEMLQPYFEKQGMPRAKEEARPSLRAGLVLATGVFDLLHVEHVELLERASHMGGKLIVGINSDESVRRIKGKHRPIIGQEDRKRMLKALRCVDEVIIFEEDTPLELIKRLRPAVLVKGHDYADGLKPVVGRAEMESWGGKVVICNTSGRVSTSHIVGACWAAVEAQDHDFTNTLRTPKERFQCRKCGEGEGL